MAIALFTTTSLKWSLLAASAARVGVAAIPLAAIFLERSSGEVRTILPENALRRCFVRAGRAYGLPDGASTGSRLHHRA